MGNKHLHSGMRLENTSVPSKSIFITIIPRVRMGSDSEAMRAKIIIVLVKSK